MIETLQPHQIFVFGSNLAGRHIGGAARQARYAFGAVEGIGEGMTGQCYAFPTLDEEFQKRSDEDLRGSVRQLFQTATENSDKEFLLTKVGCGIAGYDEEYMKEFFRESPANIMKPLAWQ